MDEPHFERFFFVISGIYRELQRLRAQFAESAGVKAVHIFWIYLLREHPEGLTAEELARASQTTSSLVSREISELVERQLIYADAQSPRRRYGWRFHLTAGGQQLAAAIDDTAMRVQQQVSRDIPVAQLENFYHVLNRLLDGFTGCELSSILSGGNE